MACSCSSSCSVDRLNEEDDEGGGGREDSPFLSSSTSSSSSFDDEESIFLALFEKLDEREERGIVLVRTGLLACHGKEELPDTGVMLVLIRLDVRGKGDILAIFSYNEEEAPEESLDSRAMGLREGMCAIQSVSSHRNEWKAREADRYKVTPLLAPFLVRG